ncbi:MAG: envelope stress response membrane protein PspC [Pseudomonadota bacterium]
MGSSRRHRHHHERSRFRAAREERRHGGGGPGRDERRDYGDEPDPRRLYRNRRRGVLAGVCAGIADHFGFSLTGTRIVTVIAAFVLMPWVVLAYIAMSIMLPTTPEEPLYRDEDEEAFWHSVRKSPIATLSQVRHKFREMEARTQRLERYVTSSRYGVDREFRELER